MHHHELKIRLTEINGKEVHLDSMTQEELGSFIAVMSSLKIIASSLIKDDDMRFSIKKGSAAGALYTSKKSMDGVINELGLAIKGESENKNVTDSLRYIQDQFKKPDYGYEFVIKDEENSFEPMSFHEKIKNAKQIRCRRKKKENDFVIECRNGKLIEIGGKKPNYHLDFTLGEKLTVKCTERQAEGILTFSKLYKYITVLVLCKKASNADSKEKFIHKAIIKQSYTELFTNYLMEYYAQENFVKQLGITYSFVDTIWSTHEESESLEILNSLIQAFDDDKFHLSELKTILVVSKPYRTSPIIKDSLENLFDTYKKKKDKELKTAW